MGGKTIIIVSKTVLKSPRMEKRARGRNMKAVFQSIRDLDDSRSLGGCHLVRVTEIL